MTAPATIEVRLSKRDFGTGLKYARKYGGRYQPATKTWIVPDQDGYFGRVSTNPAAYGWEVVRLVGCQQWTAEQGCPLHGEMCAPVDVADAIH